MVIQKYTTNSVPPELFTMKKIIKKNFKKNKCKNGPASTMHGILYLSASIQMELLAQGNDTVPAFRTKHFHPISRKSHQVMCDETKDSVHNVYIRQFLLYLLIVVPLGKFGWWREYWYFQSNHVAKFCTLKILNSSCF